LGLATPTDGDREIQEVDAMMQDDDLLRVRIRPVTLATFTDRFSIESFQLPTHALIREVIGSARAQ